LGEQALRRRAARTSNKAYRTKEKGRLEEIKNFVTEYINQKNLDRGHRAFVTVVDDI
jgi:hypothetical protein